MMVVSKWGWRGMMTSAALALFTVFGWWSHDAEAGSIGGWMITHITQRPIEITVRYAGAKLNIFGAMSRPGQIVVKIVSPDRTFKVKEKGHFGIFWLKKAQYRLTGTPQIYYILSSSPLLKILSATQIQKYGLNLPAALSAMHSAPGLTGKRRHLIEREIIKDKIRMGLFLESAHVLKIQNRHLYFADVELPAQLPLGRYKVNVYLIRHGHVVAIQHRYFDVQQARMEQWMSTTADQDPWLFGGAVIMIMIMIGLSMGIILGKAKKG